MISLYVDGKSVPYRVQRTLLVQASPWFAKALDERFEEGQTLELRFPETTQKTLEHFLRWLFDRVNPWPPYDTMTLSQLETGRRQLIAVRVWIFAERHFIPALQDLAMRNLYTLLARLFPHNITVREAYENSPPNSAMRKIMMREVTEGLRSKQQGLDGYDAAELEELCNVPGFTSDLAQQFAAVLHKRKHEVDVPGVDEYLVNNGRNEGEPQLSKAS